MKVRKHTDQKLKGKTTHNSLQNTAQKVNIEHEQREPHMGRGGQFMYSGRLFFTTCCNCRVTLFSNLMISNE